MKCFVVNKYYFVYNFKYYYYLFYLFILFNTNIILYIIYIQNCITKTESLFKQYFLFNMLQSYNDRFEEYCLLYQTTHSRINN